MENNKCLSESMFDVIKILMKVLTKNLVSKYPQQLKCHRSVYNINT